MSMTSVSSVIWHWAIPKKMIANLRGMPFGVKSLEKRQNDLVGRLFPPSERVGVNATRLVVRALELRILNIDNLEADDE